MIVPATFVAAGALAWLHFETLGRIIMPGITVWIAWYFAVLLALIYVAARSGDASTRAGAVIMAASFLAAHVIWNGSAWPIATQCLKNIAVASALVMAALVFSSKALLAAAVIHLAIVVIGAATDLGLILTAKRPMQFLAWSFPDISAGLQHAALVVVSLGAARREGLGLVDHSRPGADRWNAGFARQAVHQPKE